VKSNAHIKSLVDALRAKLGDGDDAIIASVDLAVLVAMADGTIDSDEREALTAALEAVMGARVAAPVVRHLVRESKAQIDGDGPEARAKAIGRQLAEHGAADEGLRLALAIAFSSEGMCDVERAIIAAVAQAGDVSDARFAALVTSAAAPLPADEKG
jgi:tellurite resistance protein